ncbi:hypothetical protein MMC08_002683 [Hypocenomyce scalaris]|nr:hypothetical protein [Hypocenomyce scalaris]
MRAFTLSVISTLALAPALPVFSSSLTPRSQLCANDGITVAGTLFERRSFPNPSPPSLVYPRANDPVVWCTPGTQTYLIITFVSQLPGSLVLKLLSDAYNTLVTQIAQNGDDVIPSGEFDYSGDGSLSLYTVDTNNHQQTYGVLGAAIEGLSHWMMSSGNYGAAHFIIFDGANEVAQGTVGLG